MTIKQIKAAGELQKRNFVLQTIADELKKYDLIVRYEALTQFNVGDWENQLYKFSINTLPMYFENSRDAVKFAVNNFTQEQQDELDIEVGANVFGNAKAVKWSEKTFYELTKLASFVKNNGRIYGNPK